VPIVRIDIQAGKSTAYKRDILHSVRSAIVEALGVAEGRIMQRIVETPAENIDSPEGRTDRLTIVEVAMLPGRDAPLKQAMYAAIVAHLGEKPGIHQHDITVLVADPAAECFAIGGVMQCTLPAAADDEDAADADTFAAEDTGA
jgi:phenylpyruvate tautomerase PptA (4-oxalocrotonate tautomerase family)